jgi:hypothetical protein
MNANCFSNQSLNSNKSLLLYQSIVNLRKNNYRLAVSYSREALNLNNNDFSALMLHAISLFHESKFQKSKYYIVRAKNSASTEVQIEVCKKLQQLIDNKVVFNLTQ